MRLHRGWLTHTQRPALAAEPKSAKETISQLAGRMSQVANRVRRAHAVSLLARKQRKPLPAPVAAGPRAAGFAVVFKRSLSKQEQSKRSLLTLSARLALLDLRRRKKAEREAATAAPVPVLAGQELRRLLDELDGVLEALMLAVALSELCGACARRSCGPLTQSGVQMRRFIRPLPAYLLRRHPSPPMSRTTRTLASQATFPPSSAWRLAGTAAPRQTTASMTSTPRSAPSTR